jgi:FKBP-type peptidyl-prolyl cis-trans isomerase FklB
MYLGIITAIVLIFVIAIFAPAFMAPSKEDIRARTKERDDMIAEINKQRGEEFLAENKKKKGVVTRPSGLQYLVVKEGTGEQPKLTDAVTIHYTGTYIDGLVFDSSTRRGEPVTLPLRLLIPGWQEALPLMKEGSQWRIFVPPELGYGSKGSEKMGPNQTLVFEIELLEIARNK